MENDALLEEGLEDIHAGQTHRDRLLRLAPSVQQAALVTRDGLEERLEEGRRFSSDVQARTYSRGGSRGGRGWGVAGRNQVRHAQRRFVYAQDSTSKRLQAPRVPTAGTPNAQQQLLSNPMSRVLLPSITGRPAASESQGGFAGRVRAQVNTSASTTNRGRPPRAK